jgi:hypothetical protein
MHATILWIFFSKSKDLDSKLRGCRIHIINGLFFKFIWKMKIKRFNTNLTLSLILRFNLRLSGYSIWSAIYIAPHVKEDLRLLGARAPHNLEAIKEVLGRHFQDGVSEELEDGFRSTRNPAVLGYEELGGLSDSGPRDRTHGMNTLRYRMGHVPYLIYVVSYLNTSRTSRNRWKHPSSTRIGLLSSY